MEIYSLGRCRQLTHTHTHWSPHSTDNNSKSTFPNSQQNERTNVAAMCCNEEHAFCPCSCTASREATKKTRLNTCDSIGPHRRALCFPNLDARIRIIVNLYQSRASVSARLRNHCRCRLRCRRRKSRENILRNEIMFRCWIVLLQSSTWKLAAFTCFMCMVCALLFGNKNDLTAEYDVIP